MTISKNAKVLYGAAAASVLLTGGVLYLQNNALTDLKGQVAVVRTKAEAQRDAPAKLLQAERDLTGLKAQLAHLEQGIPDAAYVPTMLKELEAMGKTKGMEITGLRPAAARPVAMVEKQPLEGKPYDPLDLELKGKANYRDVLQFVSALNSFPKILEVRTMTIAPSVNGGSTPDRLEITMGIRGFLFKQQNKDKKDGLSA